MELPPRRLPLLLPPLLLLLLLDWPPDAAGLEGPARVTDDMVRLLAYVLPGATEALHTVWEGAPAVLLHRLNDSIILGQSTRPHTPVISIFLRGERINVMHSTGPSSRRTRHRLCQRCDCEKIV